MELRFYCALLLIAFSLTGYGKQYSDLGLDYLSAKLEPILSCPVSLIENNYGRTIAIIKGLELLEKTHTALNQGVFDFTLQNRKCEEFRAKLGKDSLNRETIDTPEQIASILKFIKKNMEISFPLQKILKAGLHPYVTCDFAIEEKNLATGLAIRGEILRHICTTRLGQRSSFSGSVFGPNIGVGMAITGLKKEILMPKKAYFRKGQIIGFSRLSFSLFFKQSILLGRTFAQDQEEIISYSINPNLLGSYIGLGVFVGYLPKTTLRPNYKLIIDALGLKRYAFSFVKERN